MLSWYVCQLCPQLLTKASHRRPWPSVTWVFLAVWAVWQVNCQNNQLLWVGGTRSKYSWCEPEWVWEWEGMVTATPLVIELVKKQKQWQGPNTLETRGLFISKPNCIRLTLCWKFKLGNLNSFENTCSSSYVSKWTFIFSCISCLTWRECYCGAFWKTCRWDNRIVTACQDFLGLFCSELLLMINGH